MTAQPTRLRVAIMCRWPGRQQDLAQRCGIHNPHLSAYIRGRMALPIDHRAILAHVLDVEPRDLDGYWDGKEIWQKIAG